MSQSILRISPIHFDVIYQINPHMKVGSVDRALAMKQWEDLGKVYEEIGVTCHVLEGQPGFPDMVFSANQSFPFLNAKGEKAVILSRMAKQERRGEVPFVGEWYRAHGYEVVELPEEAGFFEGMGDTIYDSRHGQIFGAYGHRAEKKAYEYISKITGLPVLTLELVSEDFYHLDVALTVLNQDTALIYSPAFAEHSLRELRPFFKNLIEVSKEEAYNFALNAHCPDGKHVILQKGSSQTEAALKANGFIPIPVDTSEYIKSGGSVFCMKMDLL